MSERSPEAIKKIIPFAKDPYVPAPKSAFAPPPNAPQATLSPINDIPYAPHREVHSESDPLQQMDEVRRIENDRGLEQPLELCAGRDAVTAASTPDALLARPPLLETTVLR